jgi:hypothetical protein
MCRAPLKPPNAQLSQVLRVLLPLSAPPMLQMRAPLLPSVTLLLMPRELMQLSAPLPKCAPLPKLSALQRRLSVPLL